MDKNINQELTSPKGLTYSKKILLFCGIGNTLELYDYTLFAVLIAQLSVNFFPSNSPQTSLVFAYLSLAIGFFFNVIGSIFWGWYGDKFGRQKLLRITMLIMAAPSLIIGLLPTYDQIGIFAPMLLILARIMQGISASGELQGSRILALETAERKGITSGFMTASGALGVLLAFLMAYIVGHFDHPHAWRVPFLIGTVIAYIGMKIRKAQYDAINKENLHVNTVSKKIKITDLPDILMQYKVESIAAFAIGAVMGMYSYMMHAFMKPFVASHGINANDANLLSILALVATASTAIIFGWYYDKSGRNIIKIIRTNLLSMVALIVPSFILILSGNIYLIILGFITLGCMLGVSAPSCSLLMYKSFPKEVRCRGVMFVYAVSVSVLGGLTPLSLNHLSKINKDFPAFAVTTMVLLAFFLYSISIRHVVRKNVALS